MFAKTFGWSIEYIMRLSKPQIDLLLDGIVKLSESTKDKNKSNFNNKDNNDEKRKSAITLFTMPGMQMSEKARKKIDEILKRKKSD